MCNLKASPNFARATTYIFNANFHFSFCSDKLNGNLTNGGTNGKWSSEGGNKKRRIENDISLLTKKEKDVSTFSW